MQTLESELVIYPSGTDAKEKKAKNRKRAFPVLCLPLFLCVIINICFPSLCAQVLLLQRILPAIFNEVRTTLAELEGYILTYALLPDG